MKNVAFLLLLLCSIPTEAQRTYVPDENFERELIGLGYDSGQIDHYVPRANIRGVVSLNVTGLKIDDLTGIQDFVALESLFCSENNLKDLDLSKNKRLKVLRCYSNSLERLDVTKNIQLTTLTCNDNALKALDVSKNIALEDLNFSNNKIKSINLRNNVALDFLACSQNELERLDLTQNPALEYFGGHLNKLRTLNLKNGSNTVISYFNVVKNPLECIEVDDPDYSGANWKNIDRGTTFSEDCNW